MPGPAREINTPIDYSKGWSELGGDLLSHVFNAVDTAVSGVFSIVPNTVAALGSLGGGARSETTSEFAAPASTGTTVLAPAQPAAPVAPPSAEVISLAQSVSQNLTPMFDKAAYFSPADLCSPVYSSGLQGIAAAQTRGTGISSPLIS